MKLNKKQKMIIYGLILGDGFLQKTGKKNARLRIEHSAKQKEYVDWIYQNLVNVFAGKAKMISRRHPKTMKVYHYYRLQSNSSPVFGELHKKFYLNNRKIIPEDIEKFLSSQLTLAVWYMDDGYYYQRDKSAHIYLPHFKKNSQKKLLNCLKNNFKLSAKIYCRPDKRACQLNFTGDDKDKLFILIRPYIIPIFNYKLPSNPVSTESENIIEAVSNHS